MEIKIGNEMVLASLIVMIIYYGIVAPKMYQMYYEWYGVHKDYSFFTAKQFGIEIFWNKIVIICSFVCFLTALVIGCFALSIGTLLNPILFLFCVVGSCLQIIKWGDLAEPIPCPG